MTRLIALALLTLAIGCNDPAPSISTTDGGMDSGMVDGGMDSMVVVNNCESNPCQNGGSCFDNGTTFVCTCLAGFSGTMCETNIDDCASAPCLNGGTCTDGVNSFACDCAGTGFEGATCETNIDDCIGNTCQNGSTCVDDVLGYTCTCTSGWTGTLCDVDIDECATNNGGCGDALFTTCTNNNGSFACADIDECATNNGGCGNPANFTCTNNVNSAPTCDCVVGFKGVACNIPSDAMYFCATSNAPVNTAYTWNSSEPTLEVFNVLGSVRIFNMPYNVTFSNDLSYVYTNGPGATQTLIPQYAVTTTLPVASNGMVQFADNTTNFSFCLPLGF